MKTILKSPKQNIILLEYHIAYEKPRTRKEWSKVSLGTTAVCCNPTKVYHHNLILIMKKGFKYLY